MNKLQRVLNLVFRSAWTHEINVSGQRSLHGDGGSAREWHFPGEKVELRRGINEYGFYYLLFEDGNTGYFPCLYLRGVTPEPEPPPEPPPVEFTPYAEIKALAADGNWYLYELVGKVE